MRRREAKKTINADDDSPVARNVKEKLDHFMIIWVCGEGDDYGVLPLPERKSHLIFPRGMTRIIEPLPWSRLPERWNSELKLIISRWKPWHWKQLNGGVEVSLSKILTLVTRARKFFDSRSNNQATKSSGKTGSQKARFRWRWWGWQLGSAGSDEKMQRDLAPHNYPPKSIVHDSNHE